MASVPGSRQAPPSGSPGFVSHMRHADSFQRFRRQRLRNLAHAPVDLYRSPKRGFAAGHLAQLPTARPQKIRDAVAEFPASGNLPCS